MKLSRRNFARGVVGSVFVGIAGCTERDVEAKTVDSEKTEEKMYDGSDAVQEIRYDSTNEDIVVVLERYAYVSPSDVSNKDVVAVSLNRHEGILIERKGYTFGDGGYTFDASSISHLGQKFRVTISGEEDTAESFIFKIGEDGEVTLLTRETVE